MNKELITTLQTEFNQLSNGLTNINIEVLDHFCQVGKMVKIGSNVKREVEDIMFKIIAKTIKKSLQNVPKDVPLNVPIKRDKIQRIGSLKSCFVQIFSKI